MGDKMVLEVMNKKIELYYNERGGPLVIMHSDHDEGEQVWEECERIGCIPLSLAVINDIVWKHDMSPWQAPPAYKKGDPFTGGADVYLKTLTEEILTEIINKMPNQPEYMALAGYSLAGLFSIYAAYRTDYFERIVSASGSLWYPDFMYYVNTHDISDKTKAVYFSIGDKESHTKNPIISTVEKNTRELAKYLEDKGIITTFQLNAGGHFQDDVKRLSEGIKWILSIQ